MIEHESYQERAYHRQRRCRSCHAIGMADLDIGNGLSWILERFALPSRERHTYTEEGPADNQVPYAERDMGTVDVSSGSSE